MFILNWRGNVNEVLYQPSHEVLLFICVVSLACDLERLAFTSRGVILSAHLGGGQPDISGCFKRNSSIAFFYEVCGLRFVQKTKGKIPHQRGKKHHYTLRKSLFFLTLFHTNSSVAKKILKKVLLIMLIPNFSFCFL